jgi:hypothetical protein
VIQDVTLLYSTYIGAIPLVTGLVQVAKATKLPSEFAPIASMVFGWGVVVLLGSTLISAILPGIILGLASSGLYSTVKSYAGA